jgi:SagB-type dehydrogenase family enzyme
VHTTTFRRHPALLAAVEEIAGQRRITVSTDDGQPPLLVDDPRLLAALSVLPPDAFTQAQAFKVWADAGLGDVTEPLWTYCVTAAGLVITTAAATGPHRHDAYHQATRSYPFLDMGRAEAFDTDNALMRDYLTTDAYPPVYTDLPRRQRWSLAKADQVTGSAPGGYRLAEQLALLFDGTFGERRRLDASDTGTYLQVELIFKAVPSGGARHPTEALVWLRADGMPEGLYHYSVRANALDLLDVQPDPAVLADVCPALPELMGGPGPLAVVMLACAVERPMWRYRDARSARAVLVDVGHVVQHMAEVGTWLGWTWTDLPGYDAQALADHTGLDAGSMPVLAMGVLNR